MFKTIVWATDGSESADHAFPLVKSLASESGAKVVVVHSEEQLVGRGGGVRVHVDEADLITKIERQTSELSSEGIDATTKMVGGFAGGAAHRIADEASAANADLIIVGTRGHTPLAGLLVGSVTQRLLHIAPCPVLAVPVRDNTAGP